MNIVLDYEQIDTKKKKRRMRIGGKFDPNVRARVCAIDLLVLLCSCVMPLHSSNQPDDKIDSYIQCT